LQPAACRMHCRWILTHCTCTAATGGSETPSAQAERTLARDILEVAVFCSAREGDRRAFARHMAQLKPYHFEIASTLPHSPNRYALLGLNLLYLLVENKLADFHSELELMSDIDRSNECIVFPVRLEQYLMVGSYDQVSNRRVLTRSMSAQFAMHCHW
jgi:26S proteasome regulatory subunit N12